MATATLPRLEAGPRHLGIGEIVAAFVEGVIDARDMATRYDRLARMSNSELARFGLTRADIPSAAVNGIKGL